MADSGQKTEKPTQKRLQKAREEGQFVAAKDFIGAVQLLSIAATFSFWGAAWVAQARAVLGSALENAFRSDLSSGAAVALFRGLLGSLFLPLGFAAGIVLAVTLCCQLAITGMGFSFKKIAPDLKRLNPGSRLMQLPKQNLPAVIQVTVLMVVIGFCVYRIAVRSLERFMLLPAGDVQGGIAQLGSSLLDVMWQGTIVVAVFGAVDLFRQKRKFQRDLRMSKQEIKDEAKEMEGNPQIKMRIRRIRRDLLRRRMMQQVPTATAVIVNPTHYAVAIRYQPGEMAGPVVVAKGKNYLALRIKEVAIAHNVPIVENPPVARGLYEAAEVGQEIPVEFYKVIAEILAYVYHALNIAKSAGLRA